VPRRRNDPEAAVKLIRRNGAVPVLAHPLTTGDVETILQRLTQVGLLGMEAYYGEYEESVQQELRAVADRWGLIATGGSDYHGEGFRHGRDLGAPSVPMEAVERLSEAAKRTRAEIGSGASATRSG